MIKINILFFINYTFLHFFIQSSNHTYPSFVHRQGFSTELRRFPHYPSLFYSLLMLLLVLYIFLYKIYGIVKEKQSLNVLLLKIKQIRDKEQQEYPEKLALKLKEQQDKLKYNNPSREQSHFWLQQPFTCFFSKHLPNSSLQ